MVSSALERKRRDAAGRGTEPRRPRLSDDDPEWSAFPFLREASVAGADESAPGQVRGDPGPRNGAGSVTSSSGSAPAVMRPRRCSGSAGTVSIPG